MGWISSWSSADGVKNKLTLRLQRCNGDLHHTDSQCYNQTPAEDIMPVETSLRVLQAGNRHRVRSLKIRKYLSQKVPDLFPGRGGNLAILSD